MFARPHRYRRSTCISRRRKKTADQFDDPPPGWHPSRAKDRAPEGELQTRSDRVRLYFRSARRLSKPTEEPAADTCLRIGAAGRSMPWPRAG
jgi:hypothetical protein